MSNDKNLTLTVHFSDATHEIFSATEKEYQIFLSHWRNHNPIVNLTHLEGQSSFLNGLILSVDAHPITGAELEKEIQRQVSRHPFLALQIAVNEIVKQNLQPVKENLSSLDKRVDYFVDKLENPTQAHREPKTPHLAKCCIAAEPTEAERLQAIKRAS